MSLSIPISGLNPLSVVTSSDFIPIVQSSSMLTTYRTPLSVIATWISTSVTARSAFSSVSSSHSNVSDHATTSDLATLSINTSNLIYPNTSTALHAISADYATNAGTAVTASYALSMITGSSIPSSSYSFYSQTALSSSFASRSFSATSSSFASRSFSATSSSWASRSLVAASASWASSSISSSYTVTSSYVLGNFVKAFGTFYATQDLSSNPKFVPFSGSYNFISGVYQGHIYQTDAGKGMTPSPSLIVNRPQAQYGDLYTWIFYMATPLPSINYTIITSMGGEQGHEMFHMNNFPYGSRSTTAFTLSMADYNANWDDRTDETDWFQVMVLHP
jgi:hypothetical protein